MYIVLLSAIAVTIFDLVDGLFLMLRPSAELTRPVQVKLGELAAYTGLIKKQQSKTENKINMLINDLINILFFNMIASFFLV